MTQSRRVLPEKVLVLSQAANTAEFTAATSDIITKAAHGLSDEDVLTVTTTAGDLPAGLAINTYYYVISATTNTFKVSATKNGTAVDITDAGTGTHTYIREVFTDGILVNDFRWTGFGLNTSASTEATVYAKISTSETLPNFAAAVSATNRYYPQALIDTEDISSEQGDTGIPLTGTDINDFFQVNIDVARNVQVRTQNFTVGVITLTMKSSG